MPQKKHSSSKMSSKAGIPKRLLTKFGFFYKDNDLLDDLTFSYFYHSTMQNQLLHFGTVLPIAVCIVILQANYLPIIRFFETEDKVGLSLLPLVLTILYCAVFFIWDLLIGATYSTLLGIAIYATTQTNKENLNDWSFYAAILIVILAPLQLLGHVIWEKRLPAFRAFEAVFVTPFLVVLLRFTKIGYVPEVDKYIKNNYTRWANEKGGRTF
eukprot:TRINITY_DN624_c1_g2_i1.p1 TRINITY_DN624_c1_g2~~TRINITY_DN624_c1_g2_i1.p1  ORF type:complete len:212 (-),score=63.33 TRINITY_DN624_c1_g2_i1:60-695(-)